MGQDAECPPSDTTPSPCDARNARTAESGHQSDRWGPVPDITLPCVPLANRALDFPMAEEDLHRSQIARRLVDDRRLRSPQRVGAVILASQPDANDPLINQSRILGACYAETADGSPGCHVNSVRTPSCFDSAGALRGAAGARRGAWQCIRSIVRGLWQSRLRKLKSPLGANVRFPPLVTRKPPFRIRPKSVVRPQPLAMVDTAGSTKAGGRRQCPMPPMVPMPLLCSGAHCTRAAVHRPGKPGPAG